MSRDEDFANHVMEDLFSDINGITMKRLFGGYSFYKDGVIFGFIGFGELYFKVDDSNRKEFEKRGSTQFIYTHKNTKKKTPMPYWNVPAEIMEDKKELKEWVTTSVAVSKRAKKK